MKTTAVLLIVLLTHCLFKSLFQFDYFCLKLLVLVRVIFCVIFSVGNLRFCVGQSGIKFLDFCIFFFYLLFVSVPLLSIFFNDFIVFNLEYVLDLYFILRHRFLNLRSLWWIEILSQVLCYFLFDYFHSFLDKTVLLRSLYSNFKKCLLCIEIPLFVVITLL